MVQLVTSGLPFFRGRRGWNHFAMPGWFLLRCGEVDLGKLPRDAVSRFFLWVLWVFMGFPCDKNIRLSRNQTWPAGKSRINGGLYIAGKSTKKMADFPATFDDTPSGTTWDLNGVYPPVTHFDVAFTQHFQIILTGNQGFSTIQYEDNLKSQSQKSKGSKKVHEIGV